MAPCVVEVDDHADARLAPYTNLTDSELRKVVEPAEGLFLAESQKVILRALAAGYQPLSVLTEDKWLPDLQSSLEPFDIDIYLADFALLKEITGYRLHRGALAAFARRPTPSFEEVVDNAKRIVVMENLVDHTNVGLIFRSAAALGVDGIVLSPQCADPMYRRSVKTSMGAVFSLPWMQTTHWPFPLTQLHERGFQCVALTPDENAIDIRSLNIGPDDRAAILLGTEGPGLTDEALAQVDRHVRIPMSGGVDSLNVAAAAAVSFFAICVT